MAGFNVDDCNELGGKQDPMVQLLVRSDVADRFRIPHKSGSHIRKLRICLKIKVCYDAQTRDPKASVRDHGMLPSMRTAAGSDLENRIY